ncbi:Uncharacterized protein Rs2_46500 [Raphanus sativus]|nr:Uncharacterized protein Rs2_46500 [Raphanus sativus]
MAKVSKSIRFIIVFLLMTSSLLSCEARVRYTTDCTSDHVDKDQKQLQDPPKRFVQVEKVSKKQRPAQRRYPTVEDHVNFFMESELFTFPTMMRNVEASLSRMR